METIDGDSTHRHRWRRIGAAPEGEEITSRFKEVLTVIDETTEALSQLTA